MYHDDGKSNKTNKIIWVKVPFINKCWNIQNQSCTKHISEWELKTHFIVRIKKKTHFIARKKNTFHSKNKKAKKLKCNILQQEYILKVECRIVEKQWPKQVSVTPFTKSNVRTRSNGTIYNTFAWSIPQSHIFRFKQLI